MHLAAIRDEENTILLSTLADEPGAIVGIPVWEFPSLTKTRACTLVTGQHLIHIRLIARKNNHRLVQVLLLRHHVDELCQRLLAVWTTREVVCLINEEHTTCCSFHRRTNIFLCLANVGAFEIGRRTHNDFRLRKQVDIGATEYFSHHSCHCGLAGARIADKNVALKLRNWAFVASCHLNVSLHLDNTFANPFHLVKSLERSQSIATIDCSWINNILNHKLNKRLANSAISLNRFSLCRADKNVNLPRIAKPREITLAAKPLGCSVQHYGMGIEAVTLAFCLENSHESCVRVIFKMEGRGRIET
mmetsp:Transcript_11164/g.27874  ORF Transcript_11164/g.27874 Transcript_11164/m.27874 type:complete len:304 (-) Transcript_11164:552-1463(-)